MKRLTLIISLLALSVIGLAQGVFHNPLNNPKTDTIRVIMLQCDTSTFIDKMIPEDLNYKHYSANWAYGYEVRRVNVQQTVTFASGTVMEIGHSGQPMRIHQSYLDANKRPLSSSIVVWQSKPI